MSEETAKAQVTDKVSTKVKLGYGFGIFGDTVGNTLFYSFYSYFMTNIAMVLPITVGIISMLGVVWDAITDPIVAYLNNKRPLSKQATLMVWGTFPYVAALILTFTVPGGITGGLQSAYYILMALILFLGYTMYCIPYYSLLPQLTTDYTERTNITSVRSFINTFANLVAAVLPTAMVAFIAPMAGGEKGGWFWTVVILSVFVFISGFVSSRTLTKVIKEKNREATHHTSDPRADKNIFIEFTKGIRRIKTNRRSLIAICVFMISSAMHRTGGAYWITSVCKLPLTTVSLVGLVGLCSWFVLIPVGRQIVAKYDLKRVILLFLGIGTCGRILFFFIGAKNIPMAIAYYLIAAFADVACYTFMYSLGPDAFLLDELVFGYERPPVCHSASTFGLKISNAIGLFIWTSIILTVTGYNAAADVQADSTISGMHFGFTLVVAILGIISWILYYIYPITRKKYNELFAAVQEQRETGTYDYKVIDGMVSDRTMNFIKERHASEKAHPVR